jgi:hypothetical protein
VSRPVGPEITIIRGLPQTKKRRRGRKSKAHKMRRHAARKVAEETRTACHQPTCP